MFDETALLQINRFRFSGTMYSHGAFQREKELVHRLYHRKVEPMIHTSITINILKYFKFAIVSFVYPRTFLTHTGEEVLC